MTSTLIFALNFVTDSSLWWAQIGNLDQPKLAALLSPNHNPNCSPNCSPICIPNHTSNHPNHNPNCCPNPCPICNLNCRRNRAPEKSWRHGRNFIVQIWGLANFEIALSWSANSKSLSSTVGRWPGSKGQGGCNGHPHHYSPGKVRGWWADGASSPTAGATRWFKCCKVSPRTKLAWEGPPRKFLFMKATNKTIKEKM